MLTFLTFVAIIVLYLYVVAFKNSVYLSTSSHRPVDSLVDFIESEIH